MSRHSPKIAHREAAAAPWLPSVSLIVVDTSKVAPLISLGCQGGLQKTLLLIRRYEFHLLGERFRHLTEEYSRGCLRMDSAASAVTYEGFVATSRSTTSHRVLDRSDESGIGCRYHKGPGNSSSIAATHFPPGFYDKCCSDA